MAVAFFGVLGVPALALAQEGQATSQPVPDDEATARARELYREGIAASRQERWADARRALAEALALKRAPVILYGLAVAERNTGHVVSALGHFREFLDLPPESGTDAFREPARVALGELEGRVARVTIVVQPAGVDELDVRLDGQPVSLATLEEPTLVDPGDHVISASAAGFVAARRELSVDPGGREQVLLVLEPAAAGSPTAGSPDGGVPVLPIVLMVSGGAVALTGVVVGVVGIVAADSAESSDSEEAEAAVTKTIIGDVLGGVGAAVAAVGLILWLIDDGDSTETDEVALRPWTAGTVTGVQLRF
jgi:hypothetical protein